MLPSPSEDIFIAFIVFCAKRLFLAFSTIQVYLAAIKHTYISHGFNNPFRCGNGQEMELLKLTLKGVKNVASHQSIKRLPITISILKDLCSTLEKGVFGPYIDLLLYAACVMAFFGFMRCGEFTCNVNPFSPTKHLTLGDVRFETLMEAGIPMRMCIVHLKVSKIDPAGKGTDIKLFFNPSCERLCPATWMQRFITARKALGSDCQQPLFLLPDGSPLSRAVFVSHVRFVLHKAGYTQVNRYTGHSFRAGSATSAAALNMNEYMICLLGRWHSDAYKRYITTPLSVMQQAHYDLSLSPI